MIALKDRESFIKAIRTAKRVASGKRAAAACAACKTRRTRCDDTRPCKRCRSLGIDGTCLILDNPTIRTPGEEMPLICVREIHEFASEPHRASFLQNKAKHENHSNAGQQELYKTSINEKEDLLECKKIEFTKLDQFAHFLVENDPRFKKQHFEQPEYGRPTSVCNQLANNGIYKTMQFYDTNPLFFKLPTPFQPQYPPPAQPIFQRMPTNFASMPGPHLPAIHLRNQEFPDPITVLKLLMAQCEPTAKLRGDANVSTHLQPLTGLQALNPGGQAGVPT
jgi:hypothetical protein